MIPKRFVDLLRNASKLQRCVNLTACNSNTRTYSSKSKVDKSNVLLVNRLDNGIEIWSLNRPQAMNALSVQLAERLEHHLDNLQFDPSARVLVLASAVPNAFCVGADLKERLTMPQSEVGRFVSRARALMSAFENLPLPVIAAIDGYALGGGLELALACDLRVVASNAMVGLPETRLAIIPGAGGTQRLSRCVGVPLAKELIFTGRRISGTEAHRIGLAGHLVEQNEHGDAALQRAVQLAEEMLFSGPVALAAAKKAISAGAEVDLSHAMVIEQLCYDKVIPTKDRLEALKAFREKRPPVFKGE